MSPAVNSRISSPKSALAETTTSTLSLIRGFSLVLSTPTARVLNANSIPSDAPHPLDVVHTAATLLKAHVTKLSLLMINKPFTPAEIRKIISDIASTCVPAMMTGVELCQSEGFGMLLCGEMKGRVRKVFVELESIMGEVLAQIRRGDDEDGDGRDSLLSTGVVWEACDALMELKSLGIAGVALTKAQEYRAMLEDALMELKEWAEGSEEGAREDDWEDSGSEVLHFGDSLPKDRPDIKELIDVTLKRLKLVSTLYQALIKRRLKVLDAEIQVHLDPDVVARLDHLMTTLKSIPDQTDELASAFYDLDESQARKLTEEICLSGKEASEITRLDWKSCEDEFTVWASKWTTAIDRT